METIRALRGVCIGVDRHLKPGDVEQMEAAQAQYLVSIGAIELVPEAATKVVPEATVAAKPAAPEAVMKPAADDQSPKSEPHHASVKPTGKKEK
jgi:hypothetical protein